MSVTEKKVLLIGGTGVGKSFIGNIILNEMKFEASASGQSATSVIQGHSRLMNSSNSTDRIILHVIDTPGIGDTTGKTIQYLDSIIQYIRNNTINMIFIVVTKDRLTELLKKYLLALKECLGQFGDSTTVLILSKMPREQTLKRNKDGPKTVKECIDQTKTEICRELGCCELSNVICILNDPPEVEEEEIRTKVLGMTIKSAEVNKQRLQTWTERLRHYEGVLNGTVSNESAVEQMLNELQKRRDAVEKDLRWHQNRAKDCQTAALSVFWIPLVGWISAGGLAIAVADSKKKIVVLKEEISAIDREINDTKNDKNNRQKQVQNARETLQRMKALF